MCCLVRDPLCRVPSPGSTLKTPSGVDLATDRSRKLRLGDRIKYQVVNPGPLPFRTDPSTRCFFEHGEQRRNYSCAEQARYLFRGFSGPAHRRRLLVSDWLREKGRGRLRHWCKISLRHRAMISCWCLCERLGKSQKAGFCGNRPGGSTNPGTLKEACRNWREVRGSLKPQFLER